MKHTKLPSIVLAILLQCVPMARMFYTAPPAIPSGFAIIFQWIVGTAALLGSYDAVSGASTVITSPSAVTGTNGVPFTFRLTTGPQVATSYTASPLPPGLTLVSSTGRITGTPTQVGITVSSVKGCDGGNGCTPVATLTITIVAGGGGAVAPSITTPPASQTVNVGSPAAFSVTATGTAPLSYQWKFNGSNIAGATNSSYSIASCQLANAGGYSVTVGNSAGSVTSSTATLTVNQPAVAPSITTQPASQTVNVGASPSFSVAASGTAPLSYFWRFNGSNIAGGTNATLSLSNVQLANAGTYAVVVSNSAGTATSANATLTVQQPPSITTQPTSQSVTVGGNASFTVVASGTAPLSYLWRLNGSNIAGATNATLSLTNVQLGNAGTYSVVVSNVAGTATSANATLTVNQPAVAPSITTQPVNQTVNVGASASFTVGASGTAPLFYQWKFNAANVAGGTNATLGLSNVQLSNAGSYSVVVSNSVGTATSSSATLTVQQPPSITTQPTSQSVLAGNSASFSVVATGTAPLSYQWRFGASNIAGGTNSTLALSNVQNSNAGNYSVVVSNPAGSVTSSTATLTVQAAPVAPSITTQPVSQTVTAGNGVSFSVVASGTQPLSYQWRFNGGSIAGATNATYAMSNVQAGNAGAYSVFVSNVAGNATSSDATLTVQPAPIAPSITTQPVSQTVIAGAGASFTVAASGTAPLAYQWKFNAANISGGTNATLSLSNVQAGNDGAYSVVVNNVAGSATSATATLTVQQPPSITTQPANQSVVAGNTASFSVVATGTAPLSYQWRFNGGSIAGATNATYALSNVQAGNAGAYSVFVSNVAGSATSSDATLTVQPAPIAPSITTQPVNQVVNAGTNVSFSVSASGTAPFTYQWLFNGAPVAGGTNSVLTLSNVQPAKAGPYSVVVGNAAGTATSDIALLVVNVVITPPSITTQPANKTVNVGANASFSVTASGSAPLVYQWQFNGANITGGTNATVTIANAQLSNAGSYTVVITNSAGSATSAAATLTVQQPAPVAPSITSQPQSISIASGGTATFSVSCSGTAPMSYQWKYKGAPIPSQSYASLQLSNVQTNQAGDYCVVVSNAAGTVTSANATLTVQTGSGGGDDDGDDDGGDDDQSTTSTITITIDGEGTVAPNLDGQALQVGKTYSVAAKPVVGHLFKGWTGDANTSAPVLKFVMKKGMKLQANFTPNPFATTSGLYDGLFSDTNEVQTASSGFFTFALTDKGSFRGRLVIDGARSSFGGSFDTTGNASVTVPRRTGNPLTIALQVDISNGTDQVTGHVSDGTWNADLLGDRAPLSGTPSPYAGVYTLTITVVGGSDTSTATVTVDSNGIARMQGLLPDGTKIKQITSLSKNGDWPLYASVPGKGTVMGWITFTGQPSQGCDGQAVWFSPAFQTPGGYQELSVTGSLQGP